MTVHKVSDEPRFLLATLPPTSGQRRLAFAAVAALLVAFGAVAPFVAIQLPRLDAFIPTVEGIFCVNDLITAALLFSQFSVTRSRALLVLANGYLFTALIVIPHALTFPFAFAPTGLLGAGLQSTSVLYFSWHLGFPVAILIYAWSKDGPLADYEIRTSTRSIIGWSAAIVIALVCGLTLLATAGDEFMPRLFVDQTHVRATTYYYVRFNWLMTALALALLWNRRRSVLDQWLIVVVCAYFIEQSFPPTGRFTVGFYASRIFSLGTSIVVLVMLLSETTRLYAGLARSNIALQRERDNKLMNLEAVVASISHEVRQPLTAIAMNGRAGLLLLEGAPPDLEETRSALNEMITASHRASEVFGNISALFRGADQGQEPIDMNELVLEALGALRGELGLRDTTVRTELTSELPLVMGHRGQLRGVLLNLALNAIEAMDVVKDGGRVLRLRTEHHGRGAITVAVQDSGPGIDPKTLDSIFDAFVTTKAQGMGLGLAICRMIIERHGGQLTASSDSKRGALFQFVIPVNSAIGSLAVPL